MESTMPQPWYKHPYVWMLISIPLLAVVYGIGMAVVAVETDDGLVNDDYYTYGKHINRVIERDLAAAEHGLSANIVMDYTHGTMTAVLASKPGYVIPDQIHTELSHATRAGFDQTLSLQRTPQGNYFSALPTLPQGHWIVQLSADDWRINGNLYIPGDPTIFIDSKQ